MKGYTKTGIPKEISVAMRGWTRWGGPNHGYFSPTPEWTCQACGKTQAEALPAYLIRINTGEFARICACCFYVSLIRKIKNIFELIDLTRIDHGDF